MEEEEAADEAPATATDDDSADDAGKCIDERPDVADKGAVDDNDTDAPACDDAVLSGGESNRPMSSNSDGTSVSISESSNDGSN